MKREKNKMAINIKQYLYLPLIIIIGLFLLGYMGKVTVELIAKADLTENKLPSKVFPKNDNLIKSQIETEIEKEEIQAKNDKNESIKEAENSEEVINEEGPVLDSDVKKISPDKENPLNTPFSGGGGGDPPLR